MSRSWLALGMSAIAIYRFNKVMFSVRSMRKDGILICSTVLDPAIDFSPYPV